MTKLEEKLAKENELAETPKPEEVIIEKSEKDVKVEANVAKKSTKPRKIAKKATKTIGKEVKSMKRDVNGALAILVKVARTTKGVSLSSTGKQIVDDLTGEVKCCIRKAGDSGKAKVTMPKSEFPEAWQKGLSKCEGNHHMTWIVLNHPKLEDMFKKRLASKKTMYQFETEVYDGPSKARAKALGKVKGTADALGNIQTKIKALKEQEKIAKAALKAKKATKGTKTAKATA